MTAPELACCKPELVPYPSGHRWTHERSCEVRPNQKVSPGEDHPVLRGRRAWWEPQPFAGRRREALAWKAHTGRWK